AIVAADAARRAMPRATATDRARRARAADACTTARLTIAIPVIGFLAVTMVLWSGVYTVLDRYSPLYRGLDMCAVESAPSFAPVVDLAAPGPHTVIGLMQPTTWADPSLLRRVLHRDAGALPCSTFAADRNAALTYLHGLLF